MEVYGCEIEKQPKQGFTYGRTNLGSSENPLDRKLAGSLIISWLMFILIILEQSSNIFNVEAQDLQPNKYNKKDRPL